MVARQPVRSWIYNNENIDLGENWDFTYDLFPNEKVTMYFDMRGRADKASYAYKTQKEKSRAGTRHEWHCRL